MKRRVLHAVSESANPRPWRALMIEFSVVFGWLILAAVLILGGCSRAHLSKDYGKRNHEFYQRQVANPEAPSEASAPSGLSGPAAENVHKRYLDGFKKPAATSGTSLKIESAQ